MQTATHAETESDLEQLAMQLWEEAGKPAGPLDVFRAQAREMLFRQAEHERSTDDPMELRTPKHENL